MKTCPKCAEAVQDDAKVCRYCGHSFEFKMPQIGCLGLALIGGFLIYITSSTGDESPGSTTASQELAEAGKIVRIERLVKQRLRDPQSAIFEHFNGGCGYVNSRNGFGGMTGNVQFIVGANDKVVFKSDNPAAFRTVWNGHCAKTSS